MGYFNACFFFFFSFGCLGTKRILNKLINFLYSMGEIVTVAISCFFLTLFGLGLGFVFLQIQANT